MFARIVTSALFAGFCAGLIAAALQLMFVQPVLLHAELYETGALVHFGAGEPTASEVVSGGFDLTRDALSALFTTLVYTGYALILVSVMAVAARQGAVISPRAGIIWGLAGFVTVHFAPAFGLPPELPGASAADLGARQAWWFGCVAATGVGLWMLAFGRGWAAWGAAVILLLAPHLLGAPEPASFHGPTPPELGGLFAARTLGVGMAAWVLLGLFAGHFWQRELVERPAEA
jgi:cobalt transporter subunit CbtA